MNPSPLLPEDREGVRWLQLHRPQSAHALDEALHLALQAQLKIASEDPQVQSVVLSSTGAKAFCAGADLKEFSELPPQAAALRRRHLLLSTLLALMDFPKPLIAQVGGAAVGAGAMLALACDDILAASNARFHFPEISLGMASPMGCLMMEWRAGARVAHTLVQGGQACGAELAHGQGWVRAVHTGEQLAEATFALAHTQAASSGYATNKVWLHAPWRERLIAAAEAATRADVAKYQNGK